MEADLLRRPHVLAAFDVGADLVDQVLVVGGAGVPVLGDGRVGVLRLLDLLDEAGDQGGLDVAERRRLRMAEAFFEDELGDALQLRRAEVVLPALAAPPPVAALPPANQPALVLSAWSWAELGVGRFLHLLF